MFIKRKQNIIKYYVCILFLLFILGCKSTEFSEILFAHFVGLHNQLCVLMIPYLDGYRRVLVVG